MYNVPRLQGKFPLLWAQFLKETKATDQIECALRPAPGNQETG
jgi:hypothetical protein